MKSGCQQINHQGYNILGVAACVPWFKWRARLPSGADFIVGIISPTATAPAHRGQGYSLACMRGVLKQMEAGDEATVAALWTTLSTFRLYQQSGFVGVQSAAREYPLYSSDAALFYDHQADGEPSGRIERRQVEHCFSLT